MKYKLVIFDFDGTLADSLDWFVGVLDHLAEKHRFRRVFPADHETLRACTALELLRRLGVARWRVPAISRDLKAFAARDAAHIPLHRGTEATLAELEAAGVALAIVSSNSEANIRRILGPENVARIRYLEAGATLFGKRAKLKKVLRAARVSAAEALYVGDELRDEEAARAERIPFGAAAWGFARSDALRAREPAEFFATLGELAPCVLGRAAAVSR